MPPPRRNSGYRWEHGTQRFRSRSSGRFVPEDGIRGAVDAISDDASSRMAQLTQRLVDGDSSVEAWERGMRALIKDAHVSTGMAAMGGPDNLSRSDYGRLGFETRRQYDYLSRWAHEVAAGRAPLDGRAIVRARMYGQAARGTYEDIRRVNARDTGKQEERRRLHPAEHCKTCLSQAAQGWQPVGTLNRIGDSECRTNCRCTFQYRTRKPRGVAA